MQRRLRGVAGGGGNLIVVVRELQHLPKIGKGLCVILVIVGGESLPDHTQHPRCTCDIKITQRRKAAVRGEDEARTGDEGGA